MDKKSFTLVELILVIIVVGIIATFAIPGFFGLKQRAEGRQASAQLRLIHTAEKIKHLESDFYVECDDFAACNTVLDLDLPDDTWIYYVVCVGDCADDFETTTTNSAGTCTYTMTKDSANPSGAGCVYNPW